MKKVLISLLIGGLFSLYAAVRWQAAKDDALEEAPVFQLVGLNPEKTVLTQESLRGGYALLNFWATWCSVCKQETPVLQQLSQELGSSGSASTKRQVRMLGVASFDEEQRVINSEKVKLLPYEMALDEDGEVASVFGIHALPQTILLDPKGRIIYHVKGRLTSHHAERIKRLAF